MYSPLVIEHFSNPSYVGDVPNPDHEFEVGNSVCGDRIRIQLNSESDKVDQIAFRAWGCATSIATADIFCKSVTGKSYTDIEARSEGEIRDLLGELDPPQKHCIDIMMSLHSLLLKNVLKEDA
ncbi:iron-sulfur cluster assembly scaffold protein [Marinimicrobium locisalis]|uniref:iron-sulfur cluster assembly scaffold protein n=1 Tax=Marinimicrobium locisalis TaxID=546022 RepID=UPI003D2FD284